MLCCHGARFSLRQLPEVVRDVMDRLVYPGDSMQRLVADVHSDGAAGAVAQLSHYLQLLVARGFLMVAADADGRRLATLTATSPVFVLGQGQVDERAYLLSRFAYMRRFDDVVVIESPLAAARIVLHDALAAQVVCGLAEPTTLAQVSDRVPGLSPEVARPLLGILLAGGMLTEVGEEAASVEDEHQGLQSWEFHDLLFHARSREGRHDGAVGNTYPLAKHRELPPVVKPVDFDETIDLYRPDLVELERSDPPLVRVMEQRKSIREYAVEPMTVKQLGEFFFRVARVREVFPMEIETPRGNFQVEVSSRPYPTGGALFELEFYCVAQSCRGLEPGIYHYDPAQHRLGRVCGKTDEFDQLLEAAGYAIGTPPQQLQVLLVFTSRFERVTWKYTTLAYALILKDVGVVFQNMYLAAEAMGLAPCAIGGGNSDLFAKAIGSDYYSETSVGEFTLGSKC